MLTTCSEVLSEDSVLFALEIVGFGVPAVWISAVALRNYRPGCAPPRHGERGLMRRMARAGAGVGQFAYSGGTAPRGQVYVALCDVFSDLQAQASRMRCNLIRQANAPSRMRNPASEHELLAR